MTIVWIICECYYAHQPADDNNDTWIGRRVCGEGSDTIGAGDVAVKLVQFGSGHDTGCW